MFGAKIVYDPVKKHVIQDGYDPLTNAKTESIMAIGNGFFGQRAANEDVAFRECRNTFINGTFNKALPDEVTELPNLPDVTRWDVRVDGEIVVLQNDNFEDFKKTLDVKTGLLERSFTYKTANGKKLKFYFARFASMQILNNACYRMEIRPVSGGEVKVEVTSAIDGQVTNTGSMHMDDSVKRVHDYRTLEFTQQTSESKLAVTQFVTIEALIDGKIADRKHISISNDRRKIMHTVRCPVKEIAVFTKFHTMNCSIFFNKKELDIAKLTGRDAIN